MIHLRNLAVAVVLSSCLFAIAIIDGRLLAIGDGLIESVPAFYASFSRWQPAMLGGFPIYADPNKVFWYPLRLLQFVPDGFNAHVVLAYAIAGWATYGYVKAATGSAYAAVASAFSFACGGFLIAQFGHPMIVEPAAWFCVSVWALESYLRSTQANRLLGVAISIVFCFVSGQPQIAVFGVTVLIAYLLFTGFENPFSFDVAVRYLEGLSAIALGILGAAFAWLPTVVQSAASVRSKLDFANFVQLSTPLEHLALILIYPFAGGGGANALYNGGFAPGIDFVEMADYVPFASLLLASVAVCADRGRRGWFWAAVAIVGIALSVGDALPFARVTYHLPVYDLFRIPGRHAFEVTFSLAVLAGFGIAEFERRRDVRGIAIAGFLSGIVMLVATIDAARSGWATLSTPIVTIFFVLFIIQVTAILSAVLFVRRSSARSLIACGSVVLGSVTFAWTAYWRDSPPKTSLTTPPYVHALETLPLSNGQRVLTEAGVDHPELEPNLPTLWGVPEAGGYTPLQYAVSRIFLQTGEDGRLLNVNSKMSDIAAIRYFVTPAEPDVALPASSPFAPADLNDFLSKRSPNAPESIILGPRHERTADRLLLVTALGDSVDSAQGEPIATVVVRRTSGEEQRIPIRSGLETAELAYDRADVRTLIKHHKANVYEKVGDANWYLMDLPLRDKTPIASVTITMIDHRVALNVRKVSLVDTVQGQAFPFAVSDKYYGDPGHFRHVVDTAGVAIFENRRSQPGAWIAQPKLVLPATDDASRAAVRERLMQWDLGSFASIETNRPTAGGSGRATIVSDQPERREVRVSCKRTCLLVSSMTFDPAWKVTIDERPAALLRSDGFLQGAIIEPGTHVVTFRFDPDSGRIGLLLSATAIIIMLIYVTIGAPRMRRSSLA